MVNLLLPLAFAVLTGPEGVAMKPPDDNRIHSIFPATSPHSLALRGAGAGDSMLQRNATNPRGNTTMLHTVVTDKSGAPCQCEVSGQTWVPCARTVSKCIFIDLGAADGNTFNTFLNNGYGPIGNCPNGWHAILVEANPRFNTPLQNVKASYPGNVDVDASTAAYMCEATTSFFLDTANRDHNYWGSSLSPSHPDVQKSGHSKVTVPTVNLNRILFEQTVAGDYVIVKMDIEGAEWDIVPCLARAPAASLIDRLLLEMHDQAPGLVGTTREHMVAAKASLRQRGVDVPDYFSQSL